jgi:hypothetical protein
MRSPPLKASGVKEDVLYGETKNEESYLRKKIKPVKESCFKF